MFSIIRFIKVLILTFLLTYVVISFKSIIDGFDWTVETVEFILKPIKVIFKGLTGG